MTLAVFTTVCAFIANIASPLPPVQEFGLALAIGVTSAFISSTVVVGALHVVMTRWSEAETNKSTKRRLFEGNAKGITELQKKTSAQVIVAVLLITIVRVLGVSAPLGLYFSFVLEKPVEWNWYAMMIAAFISFAIAISWVRIELNRINNEEKILV